MEPTYVPLLDDAQVARAKDELFKLRRFWTPRHAELPSFTLGASVHLDLKSRGELHYEAFSRRTRQIVKRHMSWLYDMVVERLSEALDAPVRVTDVYAPPGFHIFEFHERLAELNPNAHFDLAHEDLEWAVSPNDDPERRISFTVPLDVPSGGAGFYWWPINRAMQRGKSKEERAAMEQEATRRFYPHKLGEILLHDGDHVHQIAADRAMYAGESRTSMQGHGVHEPDGWTLFW